MIDKDDRTRQWLRNNMTPEQLRRLLAIARLEANESGETPTEVLVGSIRLEGTRRGGQD